MKLFLFGLHETSISRFRSNYVRDGSEPEPAQMGLCTLNYDVGTIARGGATCPANECGSESGVNWLVDAIERRVAQASGRVERLRQALLAKAFRGELVPQNPNDEPAEALSGAAAGDGGPSDMSEPVLPAGRPVNRDSPGHRQQRH
jgi:hypothetical protein